jgi:UDP-N-acetylglucosamine--N-acetylmuramyl-(pentapeptide) pyrophosphoryl-undecaprenol N-acetylglucosamine transferase
MMRVLITGGGTGGHLYPALAVAGLLKEKDPDGKILFVGTESGLESQVVPEQGYRFCQIQAVKWPRRITWRSFGVFKSLYDGYKQGKALIREFHPQAVFATGGYVSVPLALAAARMRIPIFLHEQNSVPGMANKLLARWARVVFTAFPVKPGIFPATAKVIYTGLPVRSAILSADRQAGLLHFGFDDSQQTILVTGGSGGARAINQVMLDIYELISKDRAGLPPLQVVHLTGKREYESFCQQKKEKGINEEKIGKLIVRPYLDEMDAGMAVSDLIISRAGAATLAEITARGIAAILIPYPFATGNHQYYNARVLAEGGAAVLIKEDQLTPHGLLEEMRKLLLDRSKRLEMSQQSRSFGKPEAALAIVQEILQFKL